MANIPNTVRLGFTIYHYLLNPPSSHSIEPNCPRVKLTTMNLAYASNLFEEDTLRFSIININLPALNVQDAWLRFGPYIKYQVP